MKKLLMIALLLCLVGCQKKQPVTNVCSGNSGDVTIVSVGNEIQTMTQQFVYTFKDLNVTASFLESEKNQEELLSNFKAMYASVTKGLDITMEVEETEVVFSMTIDFTIADFSELASIGLITNEDLDHVSLEETIAQMNLTCNVQE